MPTNYLKIAQIEYDEETVRALLEEMPPVLCGLEGETYSEYINRLYTLSVEHTDPNMSTAACIVYENTINDFTLDVAPFDVWHPMATSSRSVDVNTRSYVMGFHNTFSDDYELSHNDVSATADAYNIYRDYLSSYMQTGSRVGLDAFKSWNDVKVGDIVWVQETDEDRYYTSYGDEHLVIVFGIWPTYVGYMELPEYYDEPIDITNRQDIIRSLTELFGASKYEWLDTEDGGTFVLQTPEANTTQIDDDTVLRAVSNSFAKMFDKVPKEQYRQHYISYKPRWALQVKPGETSSIGNLFNPYYDIKDTYFEDMSELKLAQQNNVILPVITYPAGQWPSLESLPIGTVMSYAEIPDPSFLSAVRIKTAEPDKCSGFVLESYMSPTEDLQSYLKLTLAIDSIGTLAAIKQDYPHNRDYAFFTELNAHTFLERSKMPTTGTLCIYRMGWSNPEPSDTYFKDMSELKLAQTDLGTPCDYPEGSVISLTSHMFPFIVLEHNTDNSVTLWHTTSLKHYGITHDIVTDALNFHNITDLIKYCKDRGFSSVYYDAYYKLSDCPVTYVYRKGWGNQEPPDTYFEDMSELKLAQQHNSSDLVTITYDNIYDVLTPGTIFIYINEPEGDDEGVINLVIPGNKTIELGYTYRLYESYTDFYNYNIHGAKNLELIVNAQEYVPGTQFRYTTWTFAEIFNLDCISMPPRVSIVRKGWPNKEPPDTYFEDMSELKLAQQPRFKPGDKVRVREDSKAINCENGTPGWNTCMDNYIGGIYTIESYDSKYYHLKEDNSNWSYLPECLEPVYEPQDTYFEDMSELKLAQQDLGTVGNYPPGSIVTVSSHEHIVETYGIIGYGHVNLTQKRDFSYQATPGEPIDTPTPWYESEDSYDIIPAILPSHFENAFKVINYSVIGDDPIDVSDVPSTNTQDMVNSFTDKVINELNEDIGSVEVVEFFSDPNESTLKVTEVIRLGWNGKRPESPDTYFEDMSELKLAQQQPKFKVGDKVRIREDSEAINCENIPGKLEPLWTSDMDRFLGGIYTIDDYDSTFGWYRIQHWSFRPECLEPAYEEDTYFEDMSELKLAQQGVESLTFGDIPEGSIVQAYSNYGHYYLVIPETWIHPTTMGSGYITCVSIKLGLAGTLYFGKIDRENVLPITNIQDLDKALVSKFYNNNSIFNSKTDIASLPSRLHLSNTTYPYYLIREGWPQEPDTYFEDMSELKLAQQPKFKVGDKVRVKTNAKAINCTTRNDGRPGWNDDDMNRFLGNICTISSYITPKTVYGYDYYRIAEDTRWLFLPECFEPVYEPQDTYFEDMSELKLAQEDLGRLGDYPLGSIVVIGDDEYPSIILDQRPNIVKSFYADYRRVAFSLEHLLSLHNIVDIKKLCKTCNESYSVFIFYDAPELKITKVYRIGWTTEEPPDTYFEDMSELKLAEKRKFTLKETRKLGDDVGVNWDKIDIKQLQLGLTVELEHTNVTHGNLQETTKIALAHLEEISDYYTRLLEMEKSAAKMSIATTQQAEAICSMFMDAIPKNTDYFDHQDKPNNENPEYDNIGGYIRQIVKSYVINNLGRRINLTNLIFKLCITSGKNRISVRKVEPAHKNGYYILTISLNISDVRLAYEHPNSKYTQHLTSIIAHELVHVYQYIHKHTTLNFTNHPKTKKMYPKRPLFDEYHKRRERDLKIFPEDDLPIAQVEGTPEYNAMMTRVRARMDAIAKRKRHKNKHKITYTDPITEYCNDPAEVDAYIQTLSSLYTSNASKMPTQNDLVNWPNFKNYLSQEPLYTKLVTRWSKENKRLAHLTLYNILSANIAKQTSLTTKQKP